MTVYVLKNGKNLSEIVDICDDEDNAEQLKANLLKTGQYKNIVIENVELSTDPITALDVVKISGVYKNGTVNSVICAHNTTSSVADTLKFNVTPTVITYTGVVNLTPAEIADSDIEALKARVDEWVIEEFKTRLENDNPIA